jgi:hypothetical protein
MVNRVSSQALQVSLRLLAKFSYKTKLLDKLRNPSPIRPWTINKGQNFWNRAVPHLPIVRLPVAPIDDVISAVLAELGQFRCRSSGPSSCLPISLKQMKLKLLGDAIIRVESSSIIPKTVLVFYVVP